MLIYGGWDSQLSGFWVGKYVASNIKEISNMVSDNSGKIKLIPAARYWKFINIANCYNESYNYDREKESHLIKNSERGAVAYLTHSKYGRNAVAISPNNNNDGYTGGSTDLATVYGANVNQSSTGNVYGIYDLYGYTYEYIAAYNTEYNNVTETGYGGANGNTNIDYRPATGVHFAYTLQQDGKKSDKYATAYSNNSNIYYPTNLADFNTGRNGSITGDGIKEVWTNSSLGWFTNYTYYISSATPFFQRNSSGLFCSKNSSRIA